VIIRLIDQVPFAVLMIEPTALPDRQNSDPCSQIEKSRKGMRQKSHAPSRRAHFTRKIALNETNDRVLTENECFTGAETKFDFSAVKHVPFCEPVSYELADELYHQRLSGISVDEAGDGVGCAITLASPSSTGL
jgi:hypothetical protein